MWLDSTLPDTELGQEEMFQHVRFRVTLDDLSRSGWTSYQDSSVQKFRN